MRRFALALALAAAAAIPAAATNQALPATQSIASLSDRYRDGRNAWEQAIQRGDGSYVRRSLEALLEKEGSTLNPSDYNEMHALVGLRNLLAQACVVEGAWEDAVEHLRKAAAAAEENAANAARTLSRIRQQHIDKLAEWKDSQAKQEQRLKELEAQPGLTQAQMKSRSHIQAFMDEQKNAMAHSERAFKSIDEVLAQLRTDKETYGKSLAEWQGFLVKEKLEVAQAGSASKYVADKVEQVKADDARPRFERISYGRRMLRLDPSNLDAKRFLNSLLGIEEPENPKPAVKKKAKKK
jgi:hypothetical protein